MYFADSARLLGLSVFLAMAWLAQGTSHARATPLGKSVSTETALLDAATRLDFTNSTRLSRFGEEIEDISSDRFGDKRMRRGFRELHRLTKQILACQDQNTRADLEHSFRETATALANLARSPMPRKVDFFQTPWFFLKRLSRPVGQGRTPATNLRAENQPDVSRWDPEASTFWRRPLSIASQDLYYGFGRTRFLLENQPICTYAAPKESYGRNPGFEVDCNGTRLKLKFA